MAPNELRRTPLLGTSVNKGKKKGRGYGPGDLLFAPKGRVSDGARTRDLLSSHNPNCPICRHRSSKAKTSGLRRFRTRPSLRRVPLHITLYRHYCCQTSLASRYSFSSKSTAGPLGIAALLKAGPCAGSEVSRKPKRSVAISPFAGQLSSKSPTLSGIH